MNKHEKTKQRTLKASISLTGKGLHTGLPVTITLRPAVENYGYVFRRIDLPDAPTIKCHAENVVSTDRSTTLSSNGVTVSTVEHCMAALYACGIDNCLIDINNSELPILDGSSAEYVHKIKQVNTIRQTADREYFTPKNILEYSDGYARLTLIPDNQFSIELDINFKSPILGKQYVQLNSLSEFADKFSPCRTFVFIKEIQELLQRGLIKGGCLNNAIVSYDEQIKQEELNAIADTMSVERQSAEKLGYILSRPLLFPNEPAGHKLLDLIGDLALTGHFINGKIIAHCPGHRVNNMFARTLIHEITA